MLADCTPAWGERVTGVPAELIEQAATHVMCEGPSLLWIGQGFQRQPRGGNAVRAVALLPIVTGNLGRAGCGVLYLNGTDSRGIDEDYLTGVVPGRERHAGADRRHGARRSSRGPRPLEGALLLEHQYRGVEPGAGAAAGVRSSAKTCSRSP